MITINQLLPIVCQELNNIPLLLWSQKKVLVTPENVMLNTRKRAIIEARQFCCFYLNKYTKLTSSAIGEEVRNYDHSTVLHSIKTIHNLIDSNTRIREIHQNIDERVKDIIINNSGESFTELLQLLKKKADEMNLSKFVFNYEGFCFLLKITEGQWLDPEYIEIL
jgi:hypothetical protein